MRRPKTLRSEHSVRRLIEATVEELAVSPYNDLTVRAVAARAAVSTTTAYTYFGSKDALIAEAYLGLMRHAAECADVNDSVQCRVSAQLRELALLIVDKPHFADACTVALMADGQALEHVRVQIAREVSRRIATALGGDFSEDVAATLHMLFSGAMLHARSEDGGYGRVGSMLEASTSLILGFENRSKPTVLEDVVS
jgi:TetR/AcrR family transcriptional regulator, cholesterol catabolism regulator